MRCKDKLKVLDLRSSLFSSSSVNGKTEAAIFSRVPEDISTSSHHLKEADVIDDLHFIFAQIKFALVLAFRISKHCRYGALAPHKCC